MCHRRPRPFLPSLLRRPRCLLPLLRKDRLHQAAADPSWADVAPLMQAKCGACHGTADMTGLALDTYANTLAGGKNGPVVVSGDSANSVLYSLQVAGGHPGMFAPEELAIVQQWIDAGALEAVEPAAGPVWEGELSALLQI